MRHCCPGWGCNVAFFCRNFSVSVEYNNVIIIIKGYRCIVLGGGVFEKVFLYSHDNGDYHVIDDYRLWHFCKL